MNCYPSREERWIAYGITLPDGGYFVERHYERILKQQRGVCRLCGNTNGGKRLAADHAHLCRVPLEIIPPESQMARLAGGKDPSLGPIRSLLCDTCNYKHIGMMDAVLLRYGTDLSTQGTLTEFESPALKFAREYKPLADGWMKKVTTLRKLPEDPALLEAIFLRWRRDLPQGTPLAGILKGVIDHQWSKEHYIGPNRRPRRL